MNKGKVIAVVGVDAPSATVKALEELGFELLLLPRCEQLDAPVSSHADMIIFPFGNKIFLSREYLERFSHTFDRLISYGYELVACDIELGRTYPQDVVFDLLMLENSIIGLLERIPNEVRLEAQKMQYSLLNSKQGYSKCSAAVVSDKAIITSDEHIAAAATAAGAEVLKITPDGNHIRLLGYDCGFIGGASGYFDDTVYFSGDITKHPDGARIIDFCAMYGKKVKSLSSDQMTDIGGIFFFTNRNLS